MKTIVNRAAIVGWVLSLSAAFAYPADGEDTERTPEERAVAEQFSEQWYVTEIVVFARPQSGTDLPAAGLAEDTTTTVARRWPRSMAQLIGTEHPFPLDPDTASDAATLKLGQGRRNDFSDRRTPNARPAPVVEESEETPTPSEAAPVQLTPQEQALQTAEADFQEAIARYEETLAANALQPQPPEELQLAAAARRLERRGMRVLWHQGWLQALPERRRPLAIQVQSGEFFGDRHELAGTVAITIGRYLHLSSNLWLQRPFAGQTVQLAAIDPANPHVASTVPPDPWGRYYRLSERRRMKSHELHYLDHPALGLLAYAQPVAVPEPLVTAWLELEALRESLEPRR